MVALLPPIKLLNSSIRFRIQEIIMVQIGGCCAQDVVRETFALFSILGYRNGVLKSFKFRLSPTNRSGADGVLYF